MQNLFDEGEINNCITLNRNKMKKTIQTGASTQNSHILSFPLFLDEEISDTNNVTVANLLFRDTKFYFKKTKENQLFIAKDLLPLLFFEDSKTKLEIDGGEVEDVDDEDRNGALFEYQFTTPLSSYEFIQLCDNLKVFTIEKNEFVSIDEVAKKFRKKLLKDFDNVVNALFYSIQEEIDCFTINETFDRFCNSYMYLRHDDGDPQLLINERMIEELLFESSVCFVPQYGKIEVPFLANDIRSRLHATKGENVYVNEDQCVYFDSNDIRDVAKELNISLIEDFDDFVSLHKF